MRKGFKELETFQKARRHIEKQIGGEMGNIERKNIKTLYKTLNKDFLIGVQKQLCPFCNRYSDGGGIMMVRKDEAEKDADIPKIMCMPCMDLSKILVSGYNFTPQEFHLLMARLREIREKRGI